MSTEKNEPRVIVDAYDIAEDRDQDEDVANISVTDEATGKPGEITVHVQMHGYTIQDMEEAIIRAAAAELLRSMSGQSKTSIEKHVQARVIEEIEKRVNAAIGDVAADALSRPMSKAPFASGSEEPVTVGEFLGLTTNKFLSTMVNHDGEPTTDHWGRRNGMPRIEWIVMQAIERKWRDALKKEADAAAYQMRDAIAKAHESHDRGAQGEASRRAPGQHEGERLNA